MSVKEHWKEYVSGWAASSTNTLITFPILKIGFRQVIQNTNTAETAKSVFQEGFSQMYRGIMSPLTERAIAVSMMFGIYSQVYHFFLHNSFTPLQSSFAGGFTTGVLQTAIMPFERIEMLMINQKFNKVYRNTPHAFQEVYRAEGVREFYRGIELCFIKNVSARTSFFVFKQLGDGYIKTIEMPLAQSSAFFLEGGAISALNMLMYYPLIAIRTQMQKEVGGPYKSSLGVLKELRKEKRLKILFRGVSLQCVRSFIGGGILNSMYELYMVLLEAFFK